MLFIRWAFEENLPETVHKAIQYLHYLRSVVVYGIGDSNGPNIIVQPIPCLISTSDQRRRARFIATTEIGCFGGGKRSCMNYNYLWHTHREVDYPSLGAMS